MYFLRGVSRAGGVAVSTLALAICAAFPASALAQEEETPAAEAAPPKKDRAKQILDKLLEKGIITEEEHKTLSEEDPTDEAAARAAARSERRKKALREAQDNQKAEAQKEQYNGRFNNGIVFETPDRRTTFNLGGRVHADYRYFDQDTSPSTFDIRRAYLTLQGKWNEWLTWDVTGDFAQSGTTLDVIWANAAWSDGLQVRAGQFKMPFSIDQLTSSRFIDFQERSLLDPTVPAKERGAMIHGVPFTGFTYGIALSNGQGKNNNEAVAQADKPDVIGRATLNIAELVGQQAKAIYHIGLMGSQGEQANNHVGFSGRSEARGYTFFTPAAFNGTNVSRQRLGGELVLAYGPVKFQGEYVQTSYSGTSTGNVSYDKSINAYYASVLWLISGERYAEAYRNGVFGRIIPIQNFGPGSPGWGAWEIGLRYSSFDASDFSLATANSGAGVTQVTSLTDPTLTNRARALTVGLKWIWNPNFKIYLNYVDTKYDNGIRFNPTGYSGFTTDRERAITMRAAFDF